MVRRVAFRAWFYFRQGWAQYFAFLFAAINTMTVTYYLAIKDVPILKEVFFSFWIYLVFVSGIGIPILIGVGYFHYKRSRAYHAEADITTESNPYYYKLPPGYWKEVIMPTYLLVTNLLLKITKNEKLTENELKTIQDIQQKMDSLIKGNAVGTTNSKFLSDQKKDTTTSL